MGEERYTLVTVVFEQDYDLLALQARSLGRYCPHDLVAAIVVVDHSAHGLSDATRRELIAEYGDLAGIVRFVRDTSLGVVGHADGWVTQQVLKLLVANIVETERYVALDAKNHLVSPLGPEHLAAPDGRARMMFHDYRRHPMRPYLERVLAYVGLDLEPCLDRFTQTATPFIMYAPIVRQMTDELSRKDGAPLETLFIERGLSEFFLYAAYVMTRAGGIDALYAGEPFPLPTVWPHMVSVEGCRAAVAQAKETRAPFFAVHRRALQGLGRRARAVVGDFWAERNLFSSPRAADDFIRAYQRRFPEPRLNMAKRWTRRTLGRLLRRAGLR